VRDERRGGAYGVERGVMAPGNGEGQGARERWGPPQAAMEKGEFKSGFFFDFDQESALELHDAVAGNPPAI
jgi:hypothetical protein